MNYKNLLCMIALFAGLLPSTSFTMNRSPRKNITRKRHTEAPVIEKNEADINNEIDNEVQKIIEWAVTEKEIDEDAFKAKKNISPILNPTENDSPITLEAKKRAKNMLFPESSPKVMVKPEEPTKSYWQSYAPQFMQNAATNTSNYVGSWVPRSVKDRINSWSTRKKVLIATMTLASLLAIGYNINTITNSLYPNKKLPYFLSVEEKRNLGIPTDVTFKREDLSDILRIENLQKINKEEQTFLNQLAQPLSNPSDEQAALKRAQELMEINESPHRWGRNFLSFKIPSEEDRRPIEERLNDPKITTAERARYLFLTQKGENPQAFLN